MKLYNQLSAGLLLLGSTHLAAPISAQSSNFQPNPIYEEAFALSSGVSPLAERAIEQTVAGVILDQTNAEPIIGATVLAKGTDIGTVTDIDGAYSLTVPDEVDTLVFSYIGYATQEIAINGQTTIDVDMGPDAQALDEVLVVGYGTQRKSDVTGSIGMVKGDELLKAPVTNALQGLQGKVAGVNVYLNSGSPTSSPRVLIRGLGTINSSSTPLYVVDGVVMEDIKFLNPNDISSIEVLKDASSTAIYGSRGANGVILVTTERGPQSEGLVVGFESFVTAGELRKKMDVLNAREWLDVVRIGMENTPKYRPGETPPVFTTDDPNLFDANGDPLYDTDWQEELTRTSISHNNQLSIQNQSEKSTYGVFLNYSRTEGIMIENYLDRLYGKVAFEGNPHEWLTVGFNLLANVSEENSFDEGGGYQSPRRTMIEMPPIFPVQFPDGTYSNSSNITDAYNLEAMANPVHVVRTQDRLAKRTQLFGNAYLVFHILDGLDLRTQFGFDKQDRYFQFYSPTDLVNISAPLGSASETLSRVNYWQQETFLNYTQDLGPHSFNGVLGLSWQERVADGFSASTQGFADDFFRFNNLGAGSQPGTPGSFYEDWAMNSYFARASYTYNSKYLLTFTGRADGSSRFGANNKYAYFPSVGLGWVVSEEPFLQGVDVLDQLKLRASYGITGNTEIPSYQPLPTIDTRTIPLGGQLVGASGVQRLGNPDLEWEKSKQFDIGLNLSLFEYRVSVEFDYYDKLTTDLLLANPIPQSTGFGSVLDNIGSISNRGIEVMVTTENIAKNRFGWSTTLNFSRNTNTIEDLGENDEDIFPGPGFVSGSNTILRVGEPLGAFWGFERSGTWGTDEAEAALAAGALPGEAKRSEEQTIIGSGLPTWSGSLINNFRFGNFDLTADLQFVFDVDVLQQYLHSVEDRSGIANGLRTILTDSWTPENQNTPVQEIRNQAYAGQNSRVDSRWVADGSYVRGNVFSLGYTLPNEIAGRVGLNNFRVYGTVQNAFVVHSDEFQGLDPETTSYDGNPFAQNVFFFQYPRPRTYTLGVNLNF